MLLVIMDAIIMFWLNKQWHSSSNGYKNQSSLCERLYAIPRKHIEHPIDITSVVFSVITSTFGTIQAIIFGIRDNTFDVCKCDVCSQNVLFCARSEWEFSHIHTMVAVLRTKNIIATFEFSRHVPNLFEQFTNLHTFSSLSCASSLTFVAVVRCVHLIVELLV